MSDENDDEIMNKVKIFSSDDEKLKLLGELLSNKSSRDIIKLLINNEMYTNTIADKLDLRVNLVIHHLKKLEDLGLLQIQNKTITKKGIDHKHYRINPYFFLAPSGIEEEIQKKGTLKKIFKDGIRFVGVAIAGIFTWFSSQSLQNVEVPESSVVTPDVIPDATVVGNITSNDQTVSFATDFPFDILLSIILTISVISIGLVLIFVKKRKKGKDY